MFYVGDFETTVGVTVEKEGKTRVWAGAVCTVSDTPAMRFRGTTIEEFIEYAKTLEDGDIILFHNLKFDASFILDYCLKNAWDVKTATQIINAGKKKKEKQIVYPKISHLISDVGTYYLITLRWGIEELENSFKEIHIWNSLLKVPMPVNKMPKTYGMDDISKGDIDYKAYRPEGYEPTSEEWDYIDRDVKIVAKAINYHLSQGHNKMTIGSDSLTQFIEMYGESRYKRDFPELRADLHLHLMKESYKGGFTWVRPDRKNKEFKKVSCNDVNSMHPGSMYYELMPYTDDIEVKEGDPREDETAKLWIANVDLYHIKCKKNRPPCIQLDKSTSYLEGDIELEHINLTITNVDWEMIQECYKIENKEFNYYIAFYRATTGLFCEFIDHWMEIKQNEELEEGLRQIAKLIVNNLYGKFGQDFEKLAKTPYYNWDAQQVKYHTDKSSFHQGDSENGNLIVPLDEKGKPMTTPYTPIAIFTCAYSRRKLIKAIIANWDRFIYCDTDSIYLIGHEDAEGIEIHPTKLGAWKKETIGERGYFIHAKCYRYYCLEKDGKPKNEWIFKCAGLPDRARKYITPENFKVGTTYIGKEYPHIEELKKTSKKVVIIEEGKLVPKVIPGGIILEEVPFTIK